ncbi:MAG TPA: hypothetical protein VNZ53_12115, partial [Steroidobacteraceae bacterium]|nr:hypothetical protein [Steroidobacteraceae bacterium]
PLLFNKCRTSCHDICLTKQRAERKLEPSARPQRHHTFHRKLIPRRRQLFGERSCRSRCFGEGCQLGLREGAPPRHLNSLDAWIAKQDDPQPSRPEALRRLADLAAKRKR